MAGGRGSLSAITISLFALLLLLLLPQISCFSINNSLETTIEAKKQASLQVDTGIGIGIGIGIGGGGSPPPESGSGSCPPPPPPPCPPPPPPKLPPPPKPKSPPKPKPKPKPKPPSPPRYPMPSDFENIYLYRAYFVIQRFKRSLTCDRKNVSQTWTGFDLCSKTSYKGFFCATPPGFNNSRRIASVDFNQFRLCAPTIYGFVDQLPDLALFHANSNNFSGTLPDLTRLPYLYEIDVSNNKLAGRFPTNVLPLSNLTFLDLRFNGFAGPVPPQVFLIPLDVLFLNNDLFAGPIPSDLFATTALYLTLANNLFIGSIPSSIGNASDNLLEVLFLNNRLSGCLPYQIGLLKKATVFDAGFNAITGPIPLSFGCLRKVEQLNLAGNLLYGEIPDAVCRLGFTANLANLSLSSNYFTSLGPSCVKLLEKGVLDIKNNCVPGCSNQRPPAECARFLKQPKVACPMTTYMPCKSPAALEGSSAGAVSSTAALPAAGESRRPQPYYSAYSALHERHKRHDRREPQKRHKRHERRDP